jgi:hypothetical protein
MATPTIAYTPPPWTNQTLLLYHGTIQRNITSVLATINVDRARSTTDFGRGFYTTTIERQARSWAWELSKRTRGAGHLPAVIRFDVNRDDLAQLECLWFARGNVDAEDFWSLVFHCRSGRPGHARATNGGWYDVVIGPVAASWRQRLAVFDADQVSFHTARAARLLDRSNPREVP